MAEIVPAFVGAEARQTCSEERPERVDGPAAGCAHQGFQFCEAELDGIQVGAVRGQVQERRADALNGEADARDFVDAEIVGNDEVAGPQGGDEDLLDVGEEARAINRALKHARRGEAGEAERRDECTRLPPATRRVVVHPGTAHRPTIPPKQIGGDTRFVKKHEVRGVPRGRRGVPGGAGEGDVRSIVFGGAYRFF